ncbi:hypothetical protein [Pedobacter paludis]|uniref:DUF4836 domain-containing protein n=1 Tax=Pedobacter paludis TaxID=2203212 RepID=A0A317EWT6_9SPHI|nr:hypothetical protein [Pedobacter paludis]PWS31291.1 hypothetical protein DF947_11845 [Pedobacter paludis]
MKKILFAISLFLIYNLANAQDLVKKIPSNAFAVATIKGDNVFKLMFVKDFNESFLGKKLLTETSKSLDKEFTSIEDFGINLNKNMYYFNQLNDSITYNCFLIPLKDATKFEGLINNKNEKIRTVNGIKTIVLPDSTSIVKWNENTLYFVTGSIRSTFFADSAKSAKYGFKDIRYQNNYDVLTDSATILTDTTYITTTEPAVEDVAVPVVKEKVQKKASIKKSGKKKALNKKTAVKPKKNKKAAKIKAVEAEEASAMDELADGVAMAVDTASVDDQYDIYQKERAEQDAKKKQLAFVWMSAQADKIFNSEYESITNNKSYVSSLDDKAIAELWVSSLQDAYNSIAPEFGTYGKAGIMKGYGSLNAKLFMDKTSFRISTGLELAQEQADSYKKIMNRKLNKNFLKYVNSEKAIGFTSYSIDTKAYLEEFPKLLKQTYGSILGGKMDEEIDLGTDLFTLLLDEEAVSNVIKGDALLVVNGLTTKDVTYTTYDYDDDYNRKEVTKTKKETLPDFLFMFSSEDNRLINKLIKYGINKNYVSVDQNIYKIEEKKSPIDIYFMIKDGIVFFGNSLTEMQNIGNNQYKASISKEHKNLLSKNNFTMLFNSKNMVGKIPDDEMGGKENAEKLNSTLSKMGNLYIKSNPIKGNVVSGEISAEIPNGHENALKYLFSLIENATK